MYINNNFNRNNLLYNTKQQDFRALQASAPRFKTATIENHSKVAIKNIEECIKKIKVLFEQLKSLSKNNPNKVIQYKNRYENFVPTQGKALTFRLQDWYMTVSQLEDHFGIIKIFTRKQNSSEPHLFLIEQDGQVYANAPANNPREFPKTPRYMTKEQIQDSRVNEQIAVADREVSNFLKCIDKTILELQNKRDGIFEPSTASAMQEVTKELELIDAATKKAYENGWYRQKMLYRKQKFPTYVSQKGDGIRFLHKDGIITISKSERYKDLIRLSLKNRYNDKIKVFYIKDGEKVLSNVNIDYSYNIPKSYKFMTEEQIKESGVEEYIQFLSTEIKAYREFLEEQFFSKPKKKNK